MLMAGSGEAGGEVSEACDSFRRTLRHELKHVLSTLREEFSRFEGSVREDFRTELRAASASTAVWSQPQPPVTERCPPAPPPPDGSLRRSGSGGGSLRGLRSRIDSSVGGAHASSAAAGRQEWSETDHHFAALPGCVDDDLRTSFTLGKDGSLEHHVLQAEGDNLKLALMHDDFFLKPKKAALKAAASPAPPSAQVDTAARAPAAAAQGVAGAQNVGAEENARNSNKPKSESKSTAQSTSTTLKDSTNEMQKLINQLQREVTRLETKRGLEGFVTNPRFDYTMGLVVLFNGVVFGLQVDYMASNDGKVHMAYQILNYFFAFTFTVEAVLKMIVYKWKFFVGPDWKWNVFDLFLVVLALSDEVLKVSVDEETRRNLLKNFLLLRMMRLGRVLRLIRMVRIIPSLKSMVCLIIASAESFFWTLILIVMAMYCIALYFTEATTVMGFGLKENPASVHWGSMYQSIISLFMAITGGDDWRNFVDVFAADDSYLLNTILFSTYIAFMTLVMLNLVTGVFVEGAQRLLKEDKHKELVRLAAMVFQEVDCNSDASLNAAEFHLVVENPKFSEFLHMCGFGGQTPEQMFDFFDSDQSGEVSLLEFVTMCLRMQQNASVADTTMIEYSLKLNQRQAEESAEDLRLTLASLRQEVTFIAGHLARYLGDGGVYVPYSQLFGHFFPGSDIDALASSEVV